MKPLSKAHWNIVLRRKEVLPTRTPIAYPVKPLGNGAYADVYMDSAERVIRVSEGIYDHILDELSPYVDWMPKVLESWGNNKTSITIRDNINCVPRESSLRNGYQCDLSGYGYGENEDEYIYKCSFVDKILEILSPGINTQILHRLMTGFLEMMVSPAEVREKAQALYQDTLATMKRTKDDNGFEFYEISPEQSIKILPSGDVLCSYQQHFLAEPYDKDYFSIIEILANNPQDWSEYRNFVLMCLSFYDDTGFMPCDITIDNLGVQNRKIIFRDPYYISERYPDFQARIGQHRIRQGLPVPEGWGKTPERLDVVSAYLAINVKNTEVINETLGTDFGDLRLEKIVNPEVPEYVIISDDISLSVSSELCYHVKEYVSTHIPVSNTFNKIIYPNPHMLSSVLGATGYDAIDMLCKPVCVQKTQSIFISKSDAGARMLFNDLDTIVWKMRNENYTSLITRMFCTLVSRGKTYITQENLEEFSLDHILSLDTSGKLHNKKPLAYTTLDMAITSFEKWMNSVRVNHLEYSPKFQQAIRIFSDFHSITGVCLSVHNFVLEDGEVKLGKYVPRSKNEFDHLSRLTGFHQEWVKLEQPSYASIFPI